jgi:hypothetical protein
MARFDLSDAERSLLRFSREAVMPEDEMRALAARRGFSIANLAHRLTDEGNTFEYRDGSPFVGSGSCAHALGQTQCVRRLRS